MYNTIGPSSMFEFNGRLNSRCLRCSAPQMMHLLCDCKQAGDCIYPIRPRRARIQYPVQRRAFEPEHSNRSHVRAISYKTRAPCVDQSLLRTLLSSSRVDARSFSPSSRFAFRLSFTLYAEDHQPDTQWMRSARRCSP